MPPFNEGPIKEIIEELFVCDARGDLPGFEHTSRSFTFKVKVSHALQAGTINTEEKRAKENNGDSNAVHFFRSFFILGQGE